MRNVLITGGAGFIGSNLADQLVRIGCNVRIFDNFSTGRGEFLETSNADVRRGDLLGDVDELRSAMAGIDTVFHLAANADVRDGWNNPDRDAYQNVIATLNVANAAAGEGVIDFVFSSTGSIYGEAEIFPTPENVAIPTQTSLYGASKIAAEGFLAAYAHAKKLRVTAFRFVSVLGPRYSHGHVIDFVRQLAKDPSKLHILGDGNQRKSYMHVEDCVRALIDIRSDSGFDVFNLGTPEFSTVNSSARWIASVMGLDPDITYSGGDRGWIGDNPLILLDVDKAKLAGWTTQRSIESSVKDTVKWILENDWIL